MNIRDIWPLTVNDWLREHGCYVDDFSETCEICGTAVSPYADAFRNAEDIEVVICEPRGLREMRDEGY